MAKIMQKPCLHDKLFRLSALDLSKELECYDEGNTNYNFTEVCDDEMQVDNIIYTEPSSKELNNDNTPASIFVSTEKSCDLFVKIKYLSFHFIYAFR